MKIGNPEVDPGEMAQFLDGVVGAVEANSFESHCLWKECEGKRSWKQNYSGLMHTVGTFHDRPVCVSLFINEVDGRKILFVDPTSRLVDHGMIRKWLDATLPATARHPAGRINYENAQNFHNLFHLEPVSERAVSTTGENKQ